VILALGVKVGRMNMKKIRARERTTCRIFLVALFVIATRGCALSVSEKPVSTYRVKPEGMLFRDML
jgi:hypothetical protein